MLVPSTAGGVKFAFAILNRSRANTAHMRQSRPYLGLDLQVKVLATFESCPPHALSAVVGGQHPLTRSLAFRACAGNEETVPHPQVMREEMTRVETSMRGDRIPFSCAWRPKSTLPAGLKWILAVQCFASQVLLRVAKTNFFNDFRILGLIS